MSSLFRVWRITAPSAHPRGPEIDTSFLACAAKNRTRLAAPRAQRGMPSLSISVVGVCQLGVVCRAAFFCFLIILTNHTSFLDSTQTRMCDFFVFPLIRTLNANTRFVRQTDTKLKTCFFCLLYSAPLNAKTDPHLFCSAERC